MINSITQFIEAIQGDLPKWDAGTKPWFRGESGSERPLCPKISEYSHSKDNYFLQSFRRQAGGLANVPITGETDLWLFLAQHYGVPTRLLDWTAGALHALYFAINRGKPNPRIFMLNPRKLNELAGLKTYDLNFPLSWTGGGHLWVALAWQNRDLRIDPQRLIDTGIHINIPLAFPATYQDQRMIAQRSCFTIHGESLDPLQDILKSAEVDVSDYLMEYQIARNKKDRLLKELSVLGVSAATVFPDLDHLAQDLVFDVKTFDS